MSIVMPKEKGPTMKTENRPIPAFIRKKCMACKICVDDCPVSCIGVEASGTVKDPHGYPFLEDETLCTHCGQCAENCPVAAIQMAAA
jgi:formate hydrogenlyase subunit 6/NADH:ubiquinone oxidoreductase subunit I